MTPIPLAKPSPNATLLVYGRITGVRLPQAAWFNADDAPAAREAAKQLRLAVFDLRNDAERNLTIGVQEGVAKSSGRALIAPVSEETFAKIEAYVKREGGDTTTYNSASQQAGSTNSTVALTEGVRASPGTPSPDAAWADLEVGSVVLVAYFDNKEQLDGWWPALIRRVDNGKYIVTWRDAPKDPPVKAMRKHVAILHPEYLKSPD